MGFAVGIGAFCFSLTRSHSRIPAHDVSFDVVSPYEPTIHPRPIVSRPIVSRPPRSTLPVELVLTILDLASYDESLQADRALLSACSLVCRDWSLAAQKLLFRHVVIRSQADSASFQSAVDPSSAKGHTLGKAVVRLRVIFDHNDPSGLSEQMFADAVIRCPDLHALDLSLYGSASPGRDLVGSPSYLRMRRPAPSFDATTLALLQCGPRISSLRFYNWSENELSLSQLLSIWPALKCLSIGGNAPVLPFNAPSPFPGALSELHMNFQNVPSLEFMDWLLHNSTGTLHVVGFGQNTSFRFFEYMLDSHGHNLESLSLPACSHFQAQVVHRCPRLQQLTVESPLVAPACFRYVGEGLQHIAFGLGNSTPLQGVLEAVNSRDSLKAVTVYMLNGGQHSSIPSLKLACARRGIHMRVTKDLGTFRRMIRGASFDAC